MQIVHSTRIFLKKQVVYLVLSFKKEITSSELDTIKVFVAIDLNSIEMSFKMKSSAFANDSSMT